MAEGNPKIAIVDFNKKIEEKTATEIVKNYLVETYFIFTDVTPEEKVITMVQNDRKLIWIYRCTVEQCEDKHRPSARIHYIV
ncbi:MAG: hypothetical protein ACMUEM_05510 [Flavobacteriales bacterium AspAUS03]